MKWHFLYTLQAKVFFSCCIFPYLIKINLVFYARKRSNMNTVYKIIKFRMNQKWIWLLLLPNKTMQTCDSLHCAVFLLHWASYKLCTELLLQ